MTPEACIRFRHTMSGTTTCGFRSDMAGSDAVDSLGGSAGFDAEGEAMMRMGNPAVRAGVGKNIPETTMWVATR